MLKTTLVSLLCLGASAISATASADPAASAFPAPYAGSPAVAPPAAFAPETLFGTPPAAPHLGWYIAPTSGFTSVAGSRAYVAGLRGALMVNQRWGFGLAGSIIGNDHTYLGENEAREIGGYGGVYGQYVLHSNSLVHASIDATIGSGGWCARSYGTDGDCYVRHFAFVEPTMNVELNLTNNVRLATGLGYRAALAERGPGLSSGDLSGITARTSLVIGVF